MHHLAHIKMGSRLMLDLFLCVAQIVEKFSEIYFLCGVVINSIFLWQKQQESSYKPTKTKPVQTRLLRHTHSHTHSIKIYRTPFTAIYPNQCL